jgi:pimeloyl-ACP methyl ester carboxylesterase
VTFGLVHGGAHGAWCWQRVQEELAELGHRGIAADLPCEDDDAGAAEYAAIVLDSLAAHDEPVVLVAHSLGGLTIPIVASRRSTRRMVFVSALLPVPGMSLRDQQVTEPEMSFPYTGGPAGLRDRFYHRCRPEDADRAMRLMRRQALKPFTEVTPLERWPDVPSTYVLSTEDRACNPEWSRRVARERLGVEAVELVGSDHSPFLSRPDELARLLVDLAAP